MRNDNSFNENFPATIVDFDYDISSTLIRKAFKSNNSDSIKDLMDRKVYDYIIEKRLYRN